MTNKLRLIAQRCVDTETRTFQALYENAHSGRLAVARFVGTSGDKDKNIRAFGDIPFDFGSAAA